MAYSGAISNTTFNALRVVDHAFRRCRLPAQGITAEMQQYALESLYAFLSSLANPKPPSWCIERQIYPLYEGVNQVQLDKGTIEVLNANLRTLQEVTGTVTQTLTSYGVYIAGGAAVSTVGVKWSGTGVALSLQTSTDGISWTTLRTTDAGAAVGEWEWWDLSPVATRDYYRLVSSSPISVSQVFLGNMPQEIPMGSLNRDTYAAQSNKVYQGRPLTYWFQRTEPAPVLNIWPAPNATAERHQVVVWRHRQIMDTQNLRQDVEVPPRWLEAIINGLAARVAAETPAVDANLVPVLEQRAAMSLQAAWDGDTDGSPTFIQPSIGMYTK